MKISYKIINSKGYEYLIHGQDLNISYNSTHSLFTIVYYKQVHTRIWLHKFFSGVYYTGPFIYFYNFLINKKFPGFSNLKILPTNFDYPGKSYKFNEKLISKLDRKIKIKLNSGIIKTYANNNFKTIIIIGIGLGIKIRRINLNVKLIDINDNQINKPPNITPPILINYSNKFLATIKPIQIIQNIFKIDNTKIESIINKPELTINSKNLYLEQYNK